MLEDRTLCNVIAYIWRHLWHVKFRQSITLYIAHTCNKKSIFPLDYDKHLISSKGSLHEKEKQILYGILSFYHRACNIKDFWSQFHFFLLMNMTCITASYTTFCDISSFSHNACLASIIQCVLLHNHFLLPFCYIYAFSFLSTVLSSWYLLTLKAPPIIYSRRQFQMLLFFQNNK